MIAPTSARGCPATARRLIALAPPAGKSWTRAPSRAAFTGALDVSMVATSEPHSRVQPGMEDLHDQVHGQIDASDDEDEGLHHEVVPLHRSLNEQPTDTWPVEELFHDDLPSEQG